MKNKPISLLLVLTLIFFVLFGAYGIYVDSYNFKKDIVGNLFSTLKSSFLISLVITAIAFIPRIKNTKTKIILNICLLVVYILAILMLFTLSEWIGSALSDNQPNYLRIYSLSAIFIVLVSIPMIRRIIKLVKERRNEIKP